MAGLPAPLAVLAALPFGQLPRPPGLCGLRAANARLRELLAERDAEIAVLREQNAGIAVLREALAALQSQVEGLAAQVKSNSLLTELSCLFPQFRAMFTVIAATVTDREW